MRHYQKSTSGGVLKLWGCAVHHYSRTQQTIATSSAEAELYAIGSGTSEGLNIVNLLQEMQLFKSVRFLLRTDSTAAKSITAKFGLGKQSKHIQLRYLYVQDLVRSGLLIVKYIRSEIRQT